VWFVCLNTSMRISGARMFLSDAFSRCGLGYFCSFLVAGVGAKRE
jgi:hypothetical protein